MPRAAGLPRPMPKILTKDDLLLSLRRIDSDEDARWRVLGMESAFRDRVKVMLDSLPSLNGKFSALGTSPYVLLFFASQRGYQFVSQIEGDLLLAKVFSSIETSAGRMIEDVVLPVYGWECVRSEMHSPYSALDGRRVAESECCVATLKSGPRCLNDEMAENFADSILSHSEQWAQDANVSHVDFTYGVLYGTAKRSNKKDWHILRNLVEKLPQGGVVLQDHRDRWSASVEPKKGLTVTATVRIGWDWWQFLGGPDTLMEVCVALIRACISPSADADSHRFLIGGMGEVASMASVDASFNVGLLQRSQIPWLFLFAAHFCDDLIP